MDSGSDIKYEHELDNVDLNDLIPGGMTQSQQETILNASSLNLEFSDYGNVNSNVNLYVEPSYFYQIPDVAPMEHQLVAISTPSPTSSLSIYPGPHNFHVKFSEAQDTTKATPWIFSHKLNKLYAAMDKSVPMHFCLENLTQPSDYSHFQVRAQVFFAQAQDFSDIVQRCSVHMTPCSTDPNMPDPGKYFLVSEDPSAQYSEVGGRHSVVVRLSQPAIGEAYITSLFRFKCRSSCMGGVNRRPTVIVFILETLQGDALGRYCVPVRVCSCPGRDIKNDENKVERKRGSEAVAPPGSQEQMINFEIPRGKRKRVKENPLGNPESLTSEVAPSVLVAQDDNEIYTLEIRGRMRYEIVKSLLRSMEFADAQKK